MTLGDVRSNHRRTPARSTAIAIVAVLLAVFGLLGLFGALELASDVHRLARHGAHIAPRLYAVVYVLIALSSAQAISGLLLSYAAYGRVVRPDRARRLVRNLTLATGAVGMLVTGQSAAGSAVANPAPTAASHPPAPHRAPRLRGEF